MKRGRPSIRHDAQNEIIAFLTKADTPVTISLISKEISKAFNREVSWNTTQKYTQELVESGRIQAMQLPHSKEENRGGLVVYTLKR